MVNERMKKTLGEIMEYLDGEEVEAMKGLDLSEDGEESGEGGTVAVLEVEKGGGEMPGMEKKGGDDSSCSSCGSSTLGGNYCPGCGTKLKGG